MKIISNFRLNTLNLLECEGTVCALVNTLLVLLKDAFTKTGSFFMVMRTSEMFGKLSNSLNF